MSQALIDALQNPAIYPHAVEGFDIIQTHLSWVILTGLYAYKIKKPLNLGFQDYTTLQQRKYYCELELKLNKRLAPEIYLDVIPISGTEQNPTLSGTKAVIEYAVKMNQFSQEGLFSNLVLKNQITPRMIENITQQVVAFHQSAPICEAQNPFGEAETVFAPMQDNFNALNQLAAAQPFLSDINQIENWAHEKYTQLKPFLTERKKNGFIRRCHGDLHLGNMVLLNDKPLIFDCIEFNESFIWTDVYNDVGFLAMDLDHYKLTSLKQIFINQYIEQANDYLGAKLLTFYQSYRAMVRAKVTALQINQLADRDPLKTKLMHDLSAFLKLALSYIQNKTPKLIITFGVSGSGKSLYSETLLLQINGALRLRSDVIRKQMFQLDPNQSSTNELLTELYSPQTTKTLYQKLAFMAKELLTNGHTTIIDATCIKAWQRKLFFDVAHELNVPLEILAFEAEAGVLEQRIQLRSRNLQDASDATVEILHRQLKELEPLSESEKLVTTQISLSDIEKLIKLKESSHATINTK